MIADLPNRVCRAAGSHLAAWHTLRGGETGEQPDPFTRCRDTLPDLFPDAFADARPAPARPAAAVAADRAAGPRPARLERTSTPGPRRWPGSGTAPAPIRLRGRSETVDTTTGEIVSTYTSEQEPLGVTHVRCGNRRASECPSCSRLYAADMFQLIRAGVAGGKTRAGVGGREPAGVRHPDRALVRAGARPARPGPPLPPAHRQRRDVVDTAGHAACRADHGEDDPLLGQPLCGDCYDYASHVVWQWWAPDLWRRFTIALHRLVAKHLGVPANRLAEVATVQYAKVAEYQLRGAVHFHALVRLDGPRTTDGFAPAPVAIDADAAWPTWSEPPPPRCG